MLYTKPELFALPKAVEAIQMLDKYNANPADSGNVRRFTLNAYEADE
jgi:hypothetical protein